MSAPQRGAMHRLHGRLFLVLSVNALNAAGTAIVVEVVIENLTGMRGMLAVPLTDDDPFPGAWVLAWRVNYVAADRLSRPARPNLVSADTMTRVIAALNAAVDP